MSPLSHDLSAFELEDLLPDGPAGGLDPDLDYEDFDRAESGSSLEVAMPGVW